MQVSENLKTEILEFLKKNKKSDVITTYLFFLSKKLKINPILFMREKKIYQGKEELLKHLESLGKLWRETEIKIQFQKESVNSQTTKIYICPFTGKVFGNNTHPNPQDAIYDWVSTCPENTERIDGVRVKRFFVSDDPDVIKNYIVERKAPITKTVYSSAVTGKLFNSKQAVIDDFVQNQIKSVPLIEVPSQNRFEIEEHFLSVIQDKLQEDKISAFVEELATSPELTPYVENWLEEEAAG